MTRTVKNHENAIDFRTFLEHNSNFNLLKNLKFLCLGSCDDKTDYRQALLKILNQFANLEHLEIYFRCDKISKIELPQLKTLKLSSVSSKLTLNTPKLATLKVDSFKNVNIIYPDQIL